MNTFDRICAATAFALGVVLLALGALGTFTGCRAHFTLPPVLGVFPAFVGWGILRAIVIAWKVPPATSSYDAELESRPVRSFSNEFPPQTNP
jgi:hypothetical protein